MTIMYLTFGQKTEYHLQAYLSMLSFRRQTTPQDRIVMVTTTPELYRHARSWADIVTISDDEVGQWKGRHQYMFRVKTMAMRQQVEAHPDDHLLFVDTDTVLYGDLQQMRAILDRGTGLLHRNEGHPSQMKGPSLKMWKTVRGRTYGHVTLGEEHCMWNSGIIGMPRQQMKQIADDTLMLLDGMLDDGVKSFNIEQYAMSVAMQAHVPLAETYDYVAHYWGNKEEWEQMATDVLLRAYMQESGLDDELQAVADSMLRQPPVFVHRSNTARRQRQFVARLFPDRNHQYVTVRT